MVRKACHAEYKVIKTSRQFLLVTVRGISIACVHLDDRKVPTRNEQTDAILAFKPDIVIGDFNDGDRLWMHKLLGCVVLAWDVLGLPIGEPGTTQSKLARIGSLVTRLHGMLSHTVCRRLESVGYENSDRFNESTKLLSSGSKFGLAPLDHAYVLRHRKILMARFCVLRDRGSDHLPIKLTLSLDD